MEKETEKRGRKKHGRERRRKKDKRGRKRQRGGKGGHLAPKAMSRGLGCNERSLLQNIAMNSAHVFVERQHLELYS